MSASTPPHTHIHTSIEIENLRQAKRVVFQMDVEVGVREGIERVHVLSKGTHTRPMGQVSLQVLRVPVSVCECV